MGSFSDYLEAKLLDHVFGATAYSAPGTLYFALFSAAPSDSGGGTELSGNAYARVAVTNNTTNLTNATGTSPTTKKNGTVITWPTATPADWAAAGFWGIFDAASSGNLIAWGAFDEARITYLNDTFSIPANSLTITLD